MKVIMTSSLPLTPIDIAAYLDIQSDDDIRIKGRRIGIEHIIYAYNEGYSPEEISNRFSGVDLKIIYSLIAWYLHNRAQIDAFIAELDAMSAVARAEWQSQRSAASLRVERAQKHLRTQPSIHPMSA